MITGKFNKDVLYNTKFTHTEEFSPAAKHKEKYGHYTNAPFKSKAYVEYWVEQKRRCLEGYVNPTTGVRITGYHYFFLNFKQLEKVEDTGGVASEKPWGFPNFWAVHYHFFHAVEQAEKEGKHLCLLKPRGTGFSEIFSSMGARDYTLRKSSKSMYFTSHKDYLIKDGILTKAWENLEFLNKESERGFRHLRHVKNQDLHKRASKVDGNGDEHRTGGEIIGRVIDNPNKVRGARGYKIYYEEGGSFPKVDAAWNMCRPLVEQGGITTGMMILWGTGGEEGPGIAGLEDIFLHPEPYNCLEFENCWDEGREGTSCGFFFPVEACMDKYMDKDGNPDFQGGKQHHIEERKKIRKKSPQKEDSYVAEYPFTPSEALMRLSSNIFPVAELQRQLNRVRSNKSIQGFLKHGQVITTEKGVKFIIDPKASPIKRYPHQESDILDGCVTMVETPHKDQTGQVPINLYQVVVDPFYAEEAEDTTSLGAVYVYKRMNAISPTEDDMIIAWYVGRPRLLSKFYRQIFDLAEFYNASIQSEIAGGGQGIVSYARENHLLHRIEKEPEMIHNREIASKVTNRGYFMNMNKDRKRLGLKYVADWLLEKRSYIDENENEEAGYILNLHKIYDEGLLEELIKFDEERNFDRVSAMIILVYMIKEKVAIQIQEAKDRSDFWNRQLHTDYNTHDPTWLTPNELNEI